MTILDKKIDFAVVVSVRNANPNGDPLAGNSPRELFDGRGEISDVCLKRKIRNRFQDFNEQIFVKSDERADDGYKYLKDRAEGCKQFATELKKDKSAAEKIACETWIDVRTFGQVFAFSGDKKNNEGGISIGIRGPVSIHPAFSVNPINIIETQITKSVSNEKGQKKSTATTETENEEEHKGSDTMGMKYRVDFGVYVFYGSINCQLAEKTGFSKDDAAKLKEALRTLFENDSSSARPDGSMEVCKLVWWEHNCKTGQYSSAKVHRTVHVTPKVEIPKSFDDYEFSVDNLDGLNPEIIEGI